MTCRQCEWWLDDLILHPCYRVKHSDLKQCMRLKNLCPTWCCGAVSSHASLDGSTLVTVWWWYWLAGLQAHCLHSLAAVSLVMSCFNIAKEVKCVKTVAVKKKKYVSWKTAEHSYEIMKQDQTNGRADDEWNSVVLVERQEALFWGPGFIPCGIIGKGWIFKEHTVLLCDHWLYF